MPLIELDDGQPPLQQITPMISKPEFRGISVDTEITPEIALITHIEGSPYAVTYYSQVISEDSGLAGSSGGISSVNQQYRRIFDMVLMVTGELSFNQDTVTKDVTYTGSATVYPFLIPNEGDMFVGELGNGKKAIFEITESRRLSIYKQACHDIEYKMVRDAGGINTTMLDERVIQTLYYDKSYLDHGQNPLLFEEEYHLVTKLRYKYMNLVREYVQMFFSREHATILVGGQLQPTYDPKLVRFLIHMLSVTEAPEIAYIRSLNTENDPVIDSPSLWDSIMDRTNSIKNAYTHVGVTSSKNFSRDPSLESIRYSGIPLVVYPTSLTGSVDMTHGFRPKTVTSLLESIKHSMQRDVEGFKPLAPIDIEFVVADTVLPGFTSTPSPTLVSKPLYHDIDPHGFYVLSGYFYRNGNTDGARQSHLETQVLNYLENRPLDIQVISKLTESLDGMTPLERTYLTPLILMLIRQRIFITV